MHRHAAWRVLVAAFGAAMALAISAAPLRAQGGLSTEGALFLLVPVGARTVGTGQTLAAAEAGSESLWGNPAGIARMTKPEIALHYSKTTVAAGSVLAFVYPAGKAGVVAVGAQLYDYGPQDFTEDPNGAVGQLLPRSVVAAATYAATVGPRLRAGVTYKVVQTRLDCTGPCGSISTFNASTSAFDAGLQYATLRADSMTFGVVMRQLGLKLQVNDNAQSDPLPTRLHLGVQALVPAMTRVLPGSELRWSAELVNRTSLNDPAVRVGAELGLQKQLYLRGGYASGTGDAAGPAFGLGFVRGRLALDFARLFSGFSADAGQPPTFLTLRVRF
ncbi:MAG: PorV/PorQ family protein [Gemmatimonadaceae bacterium]